MTVVVGSEVMDRLGELAAPFLEAAYEEAEAFTLVHEGASEEEAEAARLVQTLLLATQALMQRLPLNEFGLAAALASVCGSFMAQAQVDRRVLYAGFREQFAQVMGEMHEALRPPTEVVQ